ncbi:metal ABC transporter permease [Hoyosella subflava]|uniref:Manganese ABC transporter, inner membrane subunit MntB n=1 Tax=Hoyosella subflava (strain DSM 45089 / JCM 17490 / NBRC 109087 / DQS3-9A1) TaxID=443218 RepID=F6EJQ7_HOYSD|nr:metal ABC transporter permease [Hoyosella subflava]AEF40082.1 manganese ABC transporter, inner membrane subunit MntB [Hoyosella subflava DQS3-9A1]
MALLDLILDPLNFEFMRRAVIVATVASIVCALLSCWLILIGWSLMGDAISHAVLPGVALAYLFGAPFALGALAFALAAVAMIGTIRRTSRVKEDAAMGIVFTALFALGLVLISRNPAQVDLMHILFGNLLGIPSADLWQVVILGALAAIVLIAKRRDLTLYAFDKTHAQAIGISAGKLGALLLGLLAVTIVVALQAVGVILVVALLITPGATAYLLTSRFNRMLVLAPVIAVVCSFAGIYSSYYYDASTGGMIVLAQSTAFALAYLFSPSQGLVTGLVTHRRTAPAPNTPRDLAPATNATGRAGAES